jgi:hypothetical protein
MLQSHGGRDPESGNPSPARRPTPQPSAASCRETNRSRSPVARAETRNMPLLRRLRPAFAMTVLIALLAACNGSGSLLETSAPGTSGPGARAGDPTTTAGATTSSTGTTGSTAGPGSTTTSGASTGSTSTTPAKTPGSTAAPKSTGTTPKATTTTRPPTPTAAAAPDPTPPPTSPPATNPPQPPTTAGSPSSGVAMPVGDLPGWRQVFTEDFLMPVGEGSFPGSAYGGKWKVYDDGTRDTAGQHEGTNSRYYPSRVVSVANGILRKRLHTEDGIAMSAAILPQAGDFTHGRFSVRFRADEIAGYKVAWLLWPTSGTWPQDGEVDFPESSLDGEITAFMHRFGASNGGDQDVFQTSARFNNWHTATIEWTPDRITFILDGAVIGESTERLPANDMYWVLQTESCLGNCQPAPWVEGTLEIDWVVAYRYTG